MEIKDLSDNLALTEKQKKKKQQEIKESQQIWLQMFFPFIYSVKKEVVDGQIWNFGDQFGHDTAR